MKTRKKLVLLLSAVSLLILSGCQNPSNPSIPTDSGSSAVKKNIADFRNKNSSGSVYTGRFISEDDGEVLEQAVVNVLNNPSNFTDKEIEDLITLIDSAAGIKVVVTVPEKVKSYPSYYFGMTYVEKSGRWSTKVELDDSIRNENGKIKPQFEFEYPLVLADVETSFVFEFLFGDNSLLEITKTVTPKHGKGRVDDLPEDWENHNKYTEFKDGVMHLNNIVPPEATKVSKKIGVQFEKNKDRWWADGGKSLAEITKDIEYGHINDFYIGDIQTVDAGGNVLNISDTPYCHVWTQYFYTIKNFEGLSFFTPTIETEMMSTSFFKTPVEERTVSSTVLDGNKVTFSGNGYFDGFYKGDIKVTYNGESFIPALFVKGVKVYILAVENDNYIGKDVKLISEFMDDGGSFANIDGDSIFAKMKTDTSEANLDKTDINEITVLGDIEIPMVGYELPVTSINGTVVSMTKPGEKLLALYPKTHHYAVFVHNEANKWSDWIGYKEFALTDDITFDLCDLGIDPYKIINNQVNICLELKGADESCEKRLTDNNWVPFTGYKYVLSVTDNISGMNSGISLKINGIPAESTVREIYMRFPSGDGLQLDWTSDSEKIKSSIFFYPFVEANKEYEIEINYNDEKSRIARSVVRVTPKGGMGEITPVNFTDVGAKVEGTDFIWVTKPLIVGNNTRGKIKLNFYDGSEIEKGNWGSLIGIIKINYTTVKSTLHKGFNLIKENNENISDFSVFNFDSDPTTYKKLFVQYIYEPDDGSGDYDGFNDFAIVFKDGYLN